MEQCYLEGNLKDKNTDKEKLCHLACQGGDQNFKFFFFNYSKYYLKKN